MDPTAAVLADAERMRHADAEWLSLALMAARNQTLGWLAAFEAAHGDRRPGADATLAQALCEAGRVAWRQERWIARNLQRRRDGGVDAARGDRRASASAPLASIEPQADTWWAAGAAGPAPDAPTTRAYAAETLEITLELLHRAAGDEVALRLFRAALFDEDHAQRRFVALAQAARPEVAQAAAARLPERRLWVAREPLRWGAQTWSLGSPRSGHVPANEQWTHEVAVPPFEIDAQPVGWAAYAEFVADGGYDEPRWWSAAGRDWLQAMQRRAPRDVEQLRGGVLVRRFGRLQRVAPVEPASGLTLHEAEAWCAWAGRRLPTEPEWELAAARGAAQGFVWGDVAEWVAGRARAWPGPGTAANGAPPPAFDDAAEAPGRRVQRGLAWFEPRRLAHPKARRFVAADDDRGFAGFRSCAA